MEFWGVEVKGGQPLKVEPGMAQIVHLSQAFLGEVKKDKGTESTTLFVETKGQKLAIGALSKEKCTHIPYDLVFEKEFELSHNWKNVSVYFCGFRTEQLQEATDLTDLSDSDFGDDIPVVAEENGKPEPVDVPSKPSNNGGKPKAKVVAPAKEDKTKKNDSEDDESDDDESEDDESDDDESENDGDELMPGVEEDDSDDDDDDEDEDEDDDDEDESSDEEEEATPKKAEQSKKRPLESATKTPTEKKAKLATPQKTGGEVKKVGGHTATPYPKQAGKANNEKSKQQTPKSAGSATCGSCKKSFKSEEGLQSHTKAKHSAAK